MLRRIPRNLDVFYSHCTSESVTCLRPSNPPPHLLALSSSFQSLVREQMEEQTKMERVLGRLGGVGQEKVWKELKRKISKEERVMAKGVEKKKVI